MLALPLYSHASPSSPSSSNLSRGRQDNKEGLLDTLSVDIQNLLTLCASSSSSEPTVVTWQSTELRSLCNTLHRLLMLGVLDTNAAYWPVVSQLMPRRTAAELTTKWKARNLRALCVCWVYDCLNDRSMGMQLTAIGEQCELVDEHYRRGGVPFVRDAKAMARAVHVLAFLDDIHFDVQPDQLKDERPLRPTGATPPRVVLGRRTPVLLANPSADAHSFEARVTDAHDERTIDGAFATEGCDDALDYVHPSSAHPAVRFNSGVNGRKVVVKKKRRRNLFPTSTAATPVPRTSTPLTPNRTLGSLPRHGMLDDDALFRQIMNIDGEGTAHGNGDMNAVVDHVTSAAAPAVTPSVSSIEKSYEEQLMARASAVPHRRRMNSECVDEVAPAVRSGGSSRQGEEEELRLDSARVVELALNVFKEEGERFYKVGDVIIRNLRLQLFCVFMGHSTGSALRRYVALTDKAIYVCEQRDDLSYHACLHIPYAVIDIMTIGLCDMYMSVVRSDDHRRVTIETGCRRQTMALLTSVELAIRRGGSRSPPAVLNDTHAHEIVLRKWAANELDVPSTDVKVVSYTLCYWRVIDAPLEDGEEVDRRSRHSSVSSREPLGLGHRHRSSYLYMRKVYTNAWFTKTGEWICVYCVLAADKLYIFTDASCKRGELVVGLRAAIQSCNQTTLPQQAHAFEIHLHDNAVKEEDPYDCIQLGAPTQHEAQQWTSAVTMALCEAECQDVTATDEYSTASPCFALLTNLGLLLGQESSNGTFVRTLAVVRACNTAYAVHMRGVFALFLVTATECSMLTMRSETALRGLATALGERTAVTIVDGVSVAKDERRARLAKQMDAYLVDYWALCPHTY